MPLVVRALRIFYREAWQRKLPHGLISWRYLWPGHNEQVRRHRQLWWRSNSRWPRLLWCVLELWLWLRWMLWHGPRATWHMVKHMHSDSNPTSLHLMRRYVQALRLTLGWCILPQEWRLFGLDQHPERVLDYVYRQETPSYHALRNQARGVSTQSLRCLQDKVALAERLKPLGVPMVADVQCVTAGRFVPWTQAVAGQTQVFCKMRAGNQGQGAFAAWQTPDGWQGQGFTGQPLANTQAVETAWQQLLTLGDALVQPLLQNHPDLTHLAHDGRETITLRLITEWCQGQLTPLWPTLEVPVGLSLQGRTNYAFLVIDVPTGVMTHQLGALADKSVVPPQFEALLARPEQARAVPHWQALVQASLAAHQQFPDVQSIAWDWVITPTGPVLLEGNTGWGLTTPQRMDQGFIQRVN